MLDSRAGRAVVGTDPIYSKQCQVCGKIFDRKDTLRRHVQIHDRNRPPPKARKKACISCAASKTKCPAERPSCSTCSKRGVPCVYDQEVTATFQSDNRNNTASSVASDLSSRPENTPIVLLQDPVEPFSQDTWPANYFANQLGGVDISAPLSDPDIHSDMDWIFHDSLHDGFPSSIPMLLSEHAMAPSGTDAVMERTTSSRHLQDDEPQDGLRTPGPDSHGGLDDSWPMEWRAVPLQLSSLPSLKDQREDVLYSHHFSLPPVSELSLTGLKDYLRIPLEKSPWQAVDMSNFPSEDQMNHFVDLYFVHFHKHYPIVHRGTFDASKDFVLALAIISIGSRYSGCASSRTFATSICELVRRLLVFMPEHDPRFVRTESYVSAQLLISIHGASSGSKRLFQLSDSNRSSIIYNARCMNLFEERKPSNDFCGSLQQRWEKWIRMERARRLAWAIYNFDASSTYLSDGRPSISLNEIKMNLPCSTAHWEVDSPQAWASLHPWTDSMPPNLVFRKAVDQLFEDPESALTDIVDDYHRMILLTTLVRICWDTKESMFKPVVSFLPSSSLLWQDAARLLPIIDQLGGLLKLRKNTLTDHSLELLVQRQYIVLTSRIIAADDIADYMHLIWAKKPQAGVAHDHLVQWALQNPEKVRTIAYASAQILSIARQFPCNHPRESTFAFHGGFTLWTMAGLILSLKSLTQPTPERSKAEVCHLDWLGADYSAEAQTVRDWIQRGGSHVLRMHDVPDIVSRLGMRQVLQQTAEILRRMPVWGISQNFLNAILRVLQTDEAEG